MNETWILCIAFTCFSSFYFSSIQVMPESNLMRFKLNWAAHMFVCVCIYGYWARKDSLRNADTRHHVAKSVAADVAVAVAMAVATVFRID